MRKFTFIGILFLFSYLNALSQWTSVINPTSTSIYGSSITVDKDGYIYSAGSAFQNATEKDNYYLVKYNSNGDTLWTRSYNRSNESDQSVKLLIDDENNILITGTSYSSTNAEDIVTLKYNPAGDLLNTNIYDGTNHLKDKAVDIINDTDGNYYICGMSQLTSQRAFTLIKTNANLGKEWSKIFTSYYGADPSNMSYNATNQKIAITGHLTDWENLYLIGTVVYDTSGVKIWENYYRTIDNRSAVGFDIALNNDETVYVCGYESNATSNIWDAILLKYDTSGDTLWTRNVFANESLFAVFKSIKTDNAENIYVTGVKGNLIITAKYNKDGDLLWLNEHAGKGDYSANDTRESIKIDNNGDILVLARDYATAGGGAMMLKYTPEGEPVWTKHYNGSASQLDEPISFDIDESNNAYILINSRNSDYYFDMATVQFTSTETETSIANISKTNDVLIYPNPSSGTINFLNKTDNFSSLKIFSVNGTLVFQKNLQEDDNNINVEHLSNGIYFIELKCNNTNQISKLIIQK